MIRNKERLYLLILLILAVLFIGLRYVNKADAASLGCPAGYYDIGKEDNGDALCKKEPTGCPYGDSIPLGPDCEKQKPREENAPQVQGSVTEKASLQQSSTIENATTSTPNYTSEVFQGK